MLGESERPIAKVKKLDRITEHLSQEKTELLLLLLAKSSPNSTNTEIEIVSQPRTGGIQSFPLSLNQEEFWFLNKLQPECLALNLSSAYVLNGPLNVEALEKALNEIVKRHENLRTTFSETDGLPMQYISPAVPFTLPVIDLQGMGKEQQKLETERILSIRTFEPFDFSNGPLFRRLLIKLGEAEHVIWWGIHHILVDGLGLTILIKEIQELYSWYAFNKKHSLPELRVQCSDYGVWQRKYYAQNKMDQKMEYWKNHLSGYNPKLSLPADYSRPAISAYKGSEEPFSISPNIALQLKSLSSETGTSLFMVLLSAFYLLTYCSTSQRDIVIGSPISQRNQKDFENMIGDFSNMLLYRTLLSEADSIYDVLGKVKKTALGAYQNQEMPSQELFNALKPEVNPAYSSLFQMMFVFHQIFPKEQEQFLEGLNTHYLNIERKFSQFDISLFMFEEGQNGLYGKFEYNTDLYSRASVLKFIDRFKSVLNVIVETPEVQVSQLNSKIS